jgi:hypothetical protein
MRGLGKCIGNPVRQGTVSIVGASVQLVFAYVPIADD